MNTNKTKLVKTRYKSMNIATESRSDCEYCNWLGYSLARLHKVKCDCFIPLYDIASLRGWFRSMRPTISTFCVRFLWVWSRFGSNNCPSVLNGLVGFLKTNLFKYFLLWRDNHTMILSYFFGALFPLDSGMILCWKSSRDFQSLHMTSRIKPLVCHIFLYSSRYFMNYAY